jgi:hypothetical protein
MTTSEDRAVAQMMAVAQPRHGHDQWKREAIDAIRRIANLRRDAEAPGTTKAKLLKLARDIAKVRGSIRALDDDVRGELMVDELMYWADRVGREGERLARQIRVHRTGGATARRLATAKARLAAALAFDLLKDYGNAATLTRHRRYFNLTAMMIELATGREASDAVVERACRWHAVLLRDEIYALDQYITHHIAQSQQLQNRRRSAAA